jgi:agmatinase
MSPLDELALLLRPAGGGLVLFTTGRAEQLALQRRLYGVATDEAVQQRFRASLERIATARAVLVGLPSDVGACSLRGANLGPQAIRAALLAEDPNWPERLAAVGVVDIGDVVVVPQLLHDDMLTEPQRAAVRRALYGHLGAGVSPAEVAHLPVSPLSVAERVFDLIFQLEPGVAPLVLGGDHSTAWPVVAALGRRQAGTRWGIVQIDAHSDMFAQRLGITWCSATWSYHANELLGRGGRLVQLGIRASRDPRSYYESVLGLRQFWADVCRERPEQVLDELIAHLRDAGIGPVYLSNDIDGTDPVHACATGTPEPGGLEPDFVVALIRRLGQEIGLLGGDVMEVAPGLAPDPDSAARTLRVAVRYLRETIRAVLRQPLPDETAGGSPN